MSELQAYYDAFKTGYWAVSDPDQCRCHGTGWANSEVDTWHKCQYHYASQPHPECSEEEYEEWERRKSVVRAIFVNMEKELRRRSTVDGVLAMAAAFKAVCETILETTNGDGVLELLEHNEDNILIAARSRWRLVVKGARDGMVDLRVYGK